MATQSVTSSNFTKIYHTAPYPTISPTRPELSQAGRTVLVTGASMGIGRAIARNFALAHAETVVLVARNLDTLKATLAELQQAAIAANSPTKYLAHQADISDPTAVASLFTWLATSGIAVDVLINNAAVLSEMRSILDQGAEKIWSQFEGNVHGPLLLIDAFYKQPLLTNKQKYLVHISTQAIHMTSHPIVRAFPSYCLTKQAGTLLMQMLALEVDPAQMQIVSVHPGVIFNHAWASAPEEARPKFDDENLPGQYAVWAASEEARFLHGRFVWAA